MMARQIAARGRLYDGEGWPLSVPYRYLRPVCAPPAKHRSGALFGPNGRLRANSPPHQVWIVCFGCAPCEGVAFQLQASPGYELDYEGASTRRLHQSRRLI
jgi:hypothetical protein